MWSSAQPLLAYWVLYALYHNKTLFPFFSCGNKPELCICLHVRTKRMLSSYHYYWRCFFSGQSGKLSIMLTGRKKYQRRVPRWEKQCIRFSKRCRYQHFSIAWPGSAFPLTYLSSQELAAGKKWWKSTQYLNASRLNQVMLLFSFDLNIETPLHKHHIVVRRRPNGWLLAL